MPPADITNLKGFDDTIGRRPIEISLKIAISDTKALIGWVHKMNYSLKSQLCQNPKEAPQNRAITVQIYI